MLMAVAFTILVFACGFGIILADHENQCPSRGLAQCEMAQVEPEGPYFIPDSAYRSDIREEQPGIKLELQFLFQYVETCKPIKDLNIHLWNANPTGMYSGGQMLVLEARNPPHDSTRYLRGIQKTDSHGIVNFTTVIPGWYKDRSNHIHVEAFKDDNDDVMGIYSAQLYFYEKLTKKISNEPHYKDNKFTRTKNAFDRLFISASGWKLILEPKNIGSGFRQGMKASFVFGIKK